MGFILRERYLLISAGIIWTITVPWRLMSRPNLELLRKPGLAFAVVNLDAAYSDQILDAVPESVAIWGFSLKGNSVVTDENVVAENITHSMDGIEFDVRWKGRVEKVKVALYGDFNTENVLAVLTVMLAMGISMTEAVQKLHGIKPVAGRMERVWRGCRSADIC